MGPHFSLKVFKFRDESPDPNYCRTLKAAASGMGMEDLWKIRLKTRYWWGGRALYAIALRYLSVPEIRELTRISTYLAYGLLAVSLLLLSWRTLLIAAPLIVFGAFFSGVRHWPDVANGTPYLWTALSAAGLALLMRERASGRTSPEAVRLYCFTVGIVSSYLWQGDGHTFLAVTWIGLVVWFGGGHLDAPERIRRAVSCIVLYLTGFVTCYTLGLLVKAIFADEVWAKFWGQAVVVFDRTVSQDRVQSLDKMLQSFSEQDHPQGDQTHAQGRARSRRRDRAGRGGGVPRPAVRHPRPAWGADDAGGAVLGADRRARRPDTGGSQGRRRGAGEHALASRRPACLGALVRVAAAQRLWRALPNVVADGLGPRLCRYLADY